MRPSSRQRGFTIVELVVVMGLIALLAGITVGLMRRQDSGLVLESNSKLLRASLRLAANSARTSGTGSLVRIDREEGLIESFPVVVGGNWHFEDHTASRNGVVLNAGNIVEDGHLGRCVQLEGGAVDLGRRPFFMSPNGFRFQLWVHPDELGTADLINFGQSYRLRVDSDGALMGTVKVGAQGEARDVTTRAGILKPGRWSRVALSYDRIALTVEVNGVVYASKEDKRQVHYGKQGRLKLGGGQWQFKWRIDEARLDVIDYASSDELSPRVEVLEDSDLVIRFDGRGRLDRRFHKGPAVITLRADEDDDEETDVRIRVEMSGVIR